VRLCPVASLVLINARVVTLDPDRPQASAVAVAGDRILGVGADEDMLALAGPGAEIMDLDGRLVLPGFVDSHMHFYDFALGLKNMALADVASFSQLVARVTGAAAAAEPGSWVLGQGWNEADWPERKYPTRPILDEAAPNNPVILWRCDLHLAAVNTAALEAAGITSETPDPPEGAIDRDERGEPTGILRERAANLVKDAVVRPNDRELELAMIDAASALHSYGLTGVHDVRLMGEIEGGAGMLRAWQRLRDRGELNLRVWCGLPGENIDEACSLGLRTGLGDEFLRIGHLKYFADGGMGARTAWLVEPYLDAASGMPLVRPEELEPLLVQADRAGLAVMVHAIGDRANREVIGAFERMFEMRKKDPDARTERPGTPHRIEHVQMIRPQDLERLARLDLVACVQPHNMVLDIGMIDACVSGNGRYTYPFRDLIDSGVPTLFSSDCPVCDPKPLTGIHAAVTRRRKNGLPEGGWYPDQRVSVMEAVSAYTLSPARAYGMDAHLGGVTPGKLADIIALDGDIFNMDPMRIADTEVVLTVFGGEIVHRLI
jgi:predicted amidohydrolase YtcJ